MWKKKTAGKQKTVILVNCVYSVLCSCSQFSLEPLLSLINKLCQLELKLVQLGRWQSPGKLYQRCKSLRKFVFLWLLQHLQLLCVFTLPLHPWRTPLLNKWQELRNRCLLVTLRPTLCCLPPLPHHIQLWQGTWQWCPLDFLQCLSGFLDWLPACITALWWVTVLGGYVVRLATAHWVVNVPARQANRLAAVLWLTSIDGWWLWPIRWCSRVSLQKLRWVFQTQELKTRHQSVALWATAS